MSTVKPIPDGYRTATPFIKVKGAQSAIEFYQQAFGAEVIRRMEGPGGTIMHAVVKIGDSPIMVADVMTDKPTHSSTHLFVEDADAWWQRALAAGATVAMPLADQFWGDRYGVLVDPFDNRWAIAQHKEDVAPEEAQRRMGEAMKQMQGPPKAE